VSENPQTEDTLAAEFRVLGQNLMRSLNALWESPERRRLQQEIEDGLNTLATTLKTEAEAFGQSPTGQRLKADLEDLQQRVQSREAEAKVRQGLLEALRALNAELEKVAASWEAKDHTSTDQATR
jgi:hypothetical protein